MVAEEILTLIQKLDGITSVIKSDHILNLFEDVEGTLPHDKDRMMKMLRTFLEMDPERQRLYQVGRRLGIFRGTGDMASTHRIARAQAAYRDLGITADTVDEITDKIMMRFV